MNRKNGLDVAGENGEYHSMVLGVTFWVGALALAGLMFLWQPLTIPPEFLAKLPEWLRDHFPKTVRPLAPILLGVVAIYLGLSFFHRRPLRFRGQEFHLPSLKMALSQLAVASLDFTIAASVLFVLLPDEVEISFLHFLSIYLLAIVGGVVTHVPGGIGILELVVLTLIASNDKGIEKDALFASLLAFRVVYYWIPLFPALALLGLADVLPRKPKPLVTEEKSDPSDRAE